MNMLPVFDRSAGRIPASRHGFLATVPLVPVPIRRVPGRALVTPLLVWSATAFVTWRRNPAPSPALAPSSAQRGAGAIPAEPAEVGRYGAVTAEMLWISMATNPAAGLPDAPIDHQDVLAVTGASAAQQAGALRRTGNSPIGQPDQDTAVFNAATMPPVAATSLTRRSLQPGA